MLQLLHLLLYRLQHVVGRLQRLVLHQDGLRHQVGRVRLLADGLVDQLLRIAIAEIAGIGPHPIEHALEELTLFG